jgi:multidrug efflux system membrane fusion protein
MAAGPPLLVEVIPPDPAGSRIAGQLIFVDNAVDPGTGTIRLRARFDNRDAALWPGQFVNVSLRLFQQANAIVIPYEAVQTGPDGQFVYVVGKDMVVDVRRVTVQRSDGERAIVSNGLAKGEQVVTRGQLRLGPRTRVQISRTGPEAS